MLPETIFDNSTLIQYLSTLKEEYKLNKKILLIQTPQFLFESFNSEIVKNKGYYAFPPTGLQNIAKVLAGKNLEIDYLDLNYELLKKVICDSLFDYHSWLEILDERLKKNDYSIIGITSLTPYTNLLNPNHPLTSLLRYLREKKQYIVIVGGPNATNEYENFLKEGLCNFAVAKEGENKISFLIDLLYNFKKNKLIKNEPTSGIFFKFNERIEETRGKSGPVVLTGNLINTYKSIPIEEYKNVGCLNPFSRMAGQDKIFSVFQLNRGCRGNCRFCDVTKFMGRGVRPYPVDEVIKEIKYLVTERKVRHFDVLDDDFLGNEEAVSELLKKMVPLREKYGITWSASNGLLTASLTDKIMALIRDSGCIGFRIGVESGNEEMLKKIRKPATIPLLKEKGKLLQNYPEIFVGVNYILGLFGEETFGQMLDTFKFSCEINLDWSAFATFQFTSKETVMVENLNSKGREATNFTPAKDNSLGEIKEIEGIISGPEVFMIPKETTPSSEQVKQIWFTFNLVGNYINNKNLKPEGKPDKFVSWVEAVQISYPNNPYMPLFAGLGYVLLGNKEKSRIYLEKVQKILVNSEYWQHRFKQFKLMKLVNNFPNNAEEVYNELEELKKPYQGWIG